MLSCLTTTKDMSVLFFSGAMLCYSIILGATRLTELSLMNTYLCTYIDIHAIKYITLITELVTSISLISLETLITKKVTEVKV